MPRTWITRGAIGLVRRRFAKRFRPHANALRGQVRVDPGWRRIEDGYAARLPTDRTVEMTRKRRWRSHEPLRVEPGWWAPWQALGLFAWAGAVGIAWWQGRRHGRGPLSELHDDWDRWTTSG